MFNSFPKFCQIFSLTLLFASAMTGAAVAESDDYYNFPTGDHEGGGVRGASISCTTNANYPVPLVPQNAETLTTSSSPKLFFKVPDVVQASTLEVVLLDSKDRVVYQNGLESYQPGIVGLNLFDGSNSDALKVNSPYHWYLIQECSDNPEPSIVASGTLQRVELDREVARQIDNASGLEKVKLYRQAGIWHEAIANLADFKCDSEAEGLVSQQWIEEEFTDSNLSNRDFQSYCPNDSKLDPLVMQ